MIKLDHIFKNYKEDACLVPSDEAALATKPSEWRVWREALLVHGEIIPMNTRVVRPASESDQDFVLALESAARGCESRREAIKALRSLDFSARKDFPSIRGFLSETLGCPEADEEKVFISRPGAEWPEEQQGWKVHISCVDLEDYLGLLTKVVPALMAETTLRFKVVNPPCFNRMTGGQEGKLVTVYVPDEESLQQLLGLSGEAGQALKGTGFPVEGELHLGGRLYARYGSYTDQYITTPSGERVPDVRGRACPEWVEPLQASL